MAGGIAEVCLSLPIALLSSQMAKVVAVMEVVEAAEATPELHQTCHLQ